MKELSKRHIDQYLKKEKGVTRLSKELEFSPHTFYKELKEKGFKTRKEYYSDLNFKNEELKSRLKDKYNHITNRCRQVKGHKDNYYKDMEYMRLDEWVEFCNSKKEKILELWNEYLKSGKNFKLTISIDRIDTSKGYLPSNVRFVSHGYNTWRRNIRPIKIKFEGDWHYFMSAEEGSRYFDVRRQSIGDLLRGEYRQISEEYTVKESNIEEIISHSKVNNEEEYYKKYIYER